MHPDGRDDRVIVCADVLGLAADRLGEVPRGTVVVESLLHFQAVRVSEELLAGIHAVKLEVDHDVLAVSVSDTDAVQLYLHLDKVGEAGCMAD